MTQTEKPKNLQPGVTLIATLYGHAGTIGRIAWSPDGQKLASPSFDKVVRLWSIEGELLLELHAHTRRVFATAWSPDGKHIATAGDEGRIYIWEAESGKLISKLERLHPTAIVSLEWSPDGKHLISGGWDGVIGILNGHSLEFMHKLNGKSGHVRSVAWTSTGDRLAACFTNKRPKIWDSQSWQEITPAWIQDPFSRTVGSNYEGIIYDLAWGSDGTQLFCASSRNFVVVYRMDSRETTYLEGHTSEVRSVSCSADGRLIASKGGSNDNTVRLWRTDSVTPVSLIREVSGNSWRPSIAFNPKDHVLATFCERDTAIRLWRLNLSELLGQASSSVVTYTSAKVVLVGESNVGKSYLANRIAVGSPPKEGTIKSTHGMKFWPIEPERLSPTSKPPSDQRRDVVLWDMGGQEEYRLIHQLFLHDTTVALVLIDPTRGASAFKEVETWNKSLEKQFQGRAAVKFLVGAKLDVLSDTIDRKGLERLVVDCGFAGYVETSAITGRGVDELCDKISKAIDWDRLGKTSRPELFQRIRDIIEARRKRGDVILHVAELHQALGLDSEGYPLQRPIRGGYPEKDNDADDADYEARSILAVTEQLAAQGVIARSKVSVGEQVLVLQVQEIERYAGSLILAARNNPRGVPALELRSIAQANFKLPGIPDSERLPRGQEIPVLECTFQLMLEHGICFKHQQLLIFPSLFGPATETSDINISHTVSLYYDFAGAIDNIYASLIAWLVLAQDFGKVRLWSDRAEFEVRDRGLCGLRKIARPGGFAHMDVYFEQATPQKQRKKFISFVEDHLARYGVDIKEQIVVSCPQNFVFDEETLRKRISAGAKDVLCPRCEERHSLTEGAAEVRERDPKITDHTWALRTQIEKLREEITKQAVEVLVSTEDDQPPTRSIRILHLSDLHFTADVPVSSRLQWLLDDIKQDSGLGFDELDYLVITGDLTDKGCIEGFEKSLEFVSALTDEFALSAERCIFVPGNHDLRDLQEAYYWREDANGLKEGEWVKKDDIILARNHEKYPLRFKPFSDFFYHKFVQHEYPLDFRTQGMAIPFWETGIQFLVLNSCWQVDQFYRKRSGIHAEAVANAIKQAQIQKEDAIESGQLTAGKQPLRIAVWHHAVSGPEQMKNTEFLGNLQKNGVRLSLHGDVHEMKRDLIGYRYEKKLHIVGSGSFGARAKDLPESTPRLYNVLEIKRDLKSACVHTRCQPKPDGPWKGWNEWPRPDGGDGGLPYYDIELA
jgi:small GTP-binding protein